MPNHRNGQNLKLYAAADCRRPPSSIPVSRQYKQNYSSFTPSATFTVLRECAIVKMVRPNDPTVCYQEVQLRLTRTRHGLSNEPSTKGSTPPLTSSKWGSKCLELSYFGRLRQWRTKDEKSAAKFHYIKTVSGKVVELSIAFRVVLIYWQGVAPFPWYLNAKGPTPIGSTFMHCTHFASARQPWPHCVTSLRSAHWLASSLKLAARCPVSGCWPSCLLLCCRKNILKPLVDSLAYENFMGKFNR